MRKGDGKNPKGTRWVMQSSTGSQWVTQGHYTYDEVKRWECSSPVRVAEEHEL